MKKNNFNIKFNNTIDWYINNKKWIKKRLSN